MGMGVEEVMEVAGEEVEEDEEGEVDERRVEEVDEVEDDLALQSCCRFLLLKASMPQARQRLCLMPLCSLVRMSSESSRRFMVSSGVCALFQVRCRWT